MHEHIKNEHLIHFLNLPPDEQMLFILNLKLNQYIQDKHDATTSQISNLTTNATNETE
ncbi:hypothetical protein [Bacillus massiliigorillae]|uniref:hypothetical protein n=1 Tax=Bacillus massiliigorillae TaxID=1243664 RepID=UPI00039BBE74|nr:hypothetical protein [Bacillus massiliigorillae]